MTVKQAAGARIKDLEGAVDMLRAEVKRGTDERAALIACLRDIAKGGTLHPPRSLAIAALKAIGAA